jgi:AcrR family transcriptional regulator
LGIKERRQRQRQELKGGILAAARGIASSEGWQAVTIRKIAALIEYSPPVIYEYFGSKEEILLEVMRTGYAEQLRAVEAAAGAADGFEEALLAMGRA